MHTQNLEPRELDRLQIHNKIGELFGNVLALEYSLGRVWTRGCVVCHRGGVKGEPRARRTPL